MDPSLWFVFSSLNGKIRQTRKIFACFIQSNEAQSKQLLQLKQISERHDTVINIWHCLGIFLMVYFFLSVYLSVSLSNVMYLFSISEAHTQQWHYCLYFTSNAKTLSLAMYRELSFQEKSYYWQHFYIFPYPTGYIQLFIKDTKITKPIFTLHQLFWLFSIQHLHTSWVQLRPHSHNVCLMLTRTSVLGFCTGWECVVCWKINKADWQQCNSWEWRQIPWSSVYLKVRCTPCVRMAA